jgi:hypothetical protein
VAKVFVVSLSFKMYFSKPFIYVLVLKGIQKKSSAAVFQNIKTVGYQLGHAANLIFSFYAVPAGSIVI